MLNAKATRRSTFDEQTGSCLCGAVSYKIEYNPLESGACHCSMCRKWSGGIYLAIQAQQDQVRIKGVEHIATYSSSDWAERAFCSICGSSLYYRVTAQGPHAGTYHIGFGTLDDPEGIALTEEIFSDLKPQGYSFAQKTHAMTQAEVLAKFAAND